MLHSAGVHVQRRRVIVQLATSSWIRLAVLFGQCKTETETAVFGGLDLGGRGCLNLGGRQFVWWLPEFGARIWCLNLMPELLQFQLEGFAPQILVS